MISNEEDLSKIIKILNTLNIDYRYVYSSSILERLIQSIDEEKVYQMIDDLADTIYGAMEKSPKKDADSRKKIITNGENFVNKIITWLYDYKSEISNDSFILLGHALSESWQDYFVDVLQSDINRKNAIRYTLDYLAKDGEIESKYDNSLINHLIEKGVIGQYEAEIEDSKMSEDDKEIVRKKINNVIKL